jgi:hypothetical protein
MGRSAVPQSSIVTQKHSHQAWQYPKNNKKESVFEERQRVESSIALKALRVSESVRPSPPGR